ncbi:3-keto-5-aminohexanoate cleavage protein [Metallumcola ferriviriculae]|uniref:3-keto-5-aminohexanoate cleavage protein n=1 Tax=Metallumcola ferriviriculae TaxID=3039180 RepID=A0AAU0UPR4_9FIRM|nr:3-keto-5-aminohexanoate cleavage protein [Desulfitibacteraceae bacterium MK1]
MEQLIITAAVVGAELTEADTPYLPLSPREIAAEACRCCEAGAAVIHLHARDEFGVPTQDKEVYREIISLIKKHYDPIIQVSTGGAIGMTTAERLLPVELAPDMASLTPGTINFGEEVFYNPATLVAEFAAAMKEKGVKPELEIFDAAMVANAIQLEAEGLVPSPLHFDLVLGVPGALPAEMKNLLFLVNSLPADSTWSVAAIGRHQLPMAAAAIILGGHVRIGLEDNIYYRKGELSQGNVPLVQRVVRLAGEFERGIADAEKAKKILGIKRK